MKKIAIIIGIVAVIIIFTVIIVTKGIPPTSPSSSDTFEPITFIGSDMQTTSPFEVTTREWIIDWSYIPDTEAIIEYSGFNFFIYPRGKTEITDFVEAIIPTGNTFGSTYSYAGPGEYYIKVDCVYVESWEIVIRPA